MPSIGGLENSRTKDANLEHISSVISEEISGQNTTSIKKATTFVPAQQELERTTATMAPNKNGDVQGENKPNSPQKQTKDDMMPSRDVPENEALNGAEVAQSDNELPSNDLSDRASGGKDEEEEEGEKSALEKRSDYKNKPRASSVELLGLSKKKKGKIPDQDSLAPELEEAYKSGLQRRRSSPAKFRYASGGSLAEEQCPRSSDVDGLTAEVGKMQLHGNKDPGFANRMEEEKQSSELTPKGPEKKISVFPARSAPYQPSQPCMQYHTSGYQGMAYPMSQPPVQQQQYVRGPGSQMFQNPSAQQYPAQTVKVVCPPGKKLAVPGMRQMNNVPYTTLADGRVLRNLPTSTTPQMLNTQSTHIRLDSRREPEEGTYEWPPSPTPAFCDPNSPISQVSMSPDHPMQTDQPMASYSPGHPQPSPMLHSPPSVQSSADSNGMSTSPSSPGSPEYINSPHSVQSDESVDSGIASPSHVNQYMSSSGLNSGMVIESGNCQLQKQQNEYPYKRPTYQPRLTDDHDPDREREISRIVENLKSGLEEPKVANANFLQSNQQQQQQQQYRQPPKRQAHISQQPSPPAMVPMVQTMLPPIHHQQGIQQIQTQYDTRTLVQPPVHIQGQTPAHLQLQNMENLVATMPLDLLCSQDEDEDTALHIAISQGEPSLCSAIIKRLVQSGRADALNIRDRLGQTPVYVAVVTNQPNVVYELLQSGADVMIANKDGTTPLHYVATKGYACALRAIGCSLFNGNVNSWNINVENKFGMSPLQCAIQAHGRYEQIYDGTEGCYVNKLVDSTDTIKDLLALGADPQFQDKRSGYTAVHYAVELAPNEKVTSNTHIIKLILQVSRNAMDLLKITSYAGNTPLHVVAGRDYDEDYVVSIIDLLVSYGAEINVQNPEKQHPHDLVNKEKRRKVYSRLQGDHLQGK